MGCFSSSSSSLKWSVGSPRAKVKMRVLHSIYLHMVYCICMRKKTKQPKAPKTPKQNQPDLARKEVKPSFSLGLTRDTKRSIAAVLCVAFGVVFALGFLGQGGVVGAFLDTQVSAVAFGWGKWIFPFLLFFFGYLLLRKNVDFYVAEIVGMLFSFLAFLGLMHASSFDPLYYATAAELGKGGGYVGAFIAGVIGGFVGRLGSAVLLFALFVSGILVAFNISLVTLRGKSQLWSHVSFNFRRKKDDVIDEEQEALGDAGASSGEVSMPMDMSEGVYSTTESESSRVPEQTTDAEPSSFDNDTLTRNEPLKNNDAELVKNNIKEIRWTKKKSGQGSILETQQAVSPFHDQILADTDAYSAKQENIAIEQDSVPHQAQHTFSRSMVTIADQWKAPSLDILERSGKKAKAGNIEERKRVISETLRQFGIQVDPGEAKVGPTVTQYAFRPAPGVKLEKITALSNNLAMSLSAHPIRIEAPIPRTPFVGIEVPNSFPEQVRLRDMIESSDFANADSRLRVALGKDVSGNFVYGDLEKMPHLMVAGATGSGKSVCINTLLLSLLYRNSPEQLKLILVDPKRVELSLYDGIPHLIAPVIVENKRVINVLRWSVNQMEERYKMLQDMGARNIQSYNEKISAKRKRGVEDDAPTLPYIVIVIDELADLMASHGKEVEGAIVRLAQMARAVGIHLIVSTQRPSVQVVTGLIKTNITTRIAFKVATQIDSRTILDRGGAERLLGNGDMLYLTATDPAPRRVQGVYVSETEVRKVVAHIKEQGQHLKNMFGDSVDFGFVGREKNLSLPGDQQAMDFSGSFDDADSKYEEARAIVVRKGSASTSFLQRALRIGYNHAAGLIDELEKNGVIGPANGSKPREVFGVHSPQGEKND